MVDLFPTDSLVIRTVRHPKVLLTEEQKNAQTANVTPQNMSYINHETCDSSAAPVAVYGLYVFNKDREIL